MNMNIETGNTLNRIKHMTKDGKALLVTLGAVGSVTALGVAAAAIYNSRQMRTARTVKRTGKILYQVGTAMRNVSGIAEG